MKSENTPQEICQEGRDENCDKGPYFRGTQACHISSERSGIQ